MCYQPLSLCVYFWPLDGGTSVQQSTEKTPALSFKFPVYEYEGDFLSVPRYKRVVLNFMHSSSRLPVFIFQIYSQVFWDFGSSSTAQLNASLSALTLKFYEFTISNAL